MSAIVAIVGSSNSGKTTLIEKLIQQLKARGYRVATIKHIHRSASFDEPNKDTWRHIQAGSQATIASFRDRLVLIKPVSPKITLDEISHQFGEDYDIILAEGFKQSEIPKIEVHRRGVAPPLTNLKKLVAIATDEPLATKTRQFALDDIKSLVNLLEEEFIKTAKVKREVTS